MVTSLAHCLDSCYLDTVRVSGAEGQKVAAMRVATLQSIHSDENFDLFW